VHYSARMSHAALPDDIETLKRLVIGRDEMIAKLMAEIARLKRWRFGRSVERIDAALAQLQLLLGDLPAAAAGEVSDAAVLPSRNRRSRHRCSNG